MFDSVFLSIAISLVFIFLLIAIMVTAFNQFVFTYWRAGAKQLESYLTKLFFNDSFWTETFNEIKKSPFISVLQKNPGNFPGSIPAENFTSALLASLGGNNITIDAIKKKLATIKDTDSDFYKLMQTLLSEEPTIDHLKQDIDKLFNNAMVRLSGWYTRNAKLWSFFVALAICIILNVDAINITKNLWNNKDKADRIASFAATASKYIEKNDSSQIVFKEGVDTLVSVSVETVSKQKAMTEELSALADSNVKKPAQQVIRSYNILADLDIPIGWSKSNIPGSQNGGITFILLWFLKLLGILLTALATSLGAPFWFDVLNKVSPLKKATVTVPHSQSSPMPQPAKPAEDPKTAKK
jgi:hypothetical protein